MPPVTFAQTRRSFGAKPTTGQTQGPANMGGPPPQQQQSVEQGPPSVGFNVEQVDPGLMSGVMQARGMSAQQANKIAQQAMGNTGQGFGITGTGNFGQVTDTSDQGTDTSDQDDDKQTLTKKVEDTATKIIDLFTGDEIKQLDKLQLQAAQNLLNEYQKLGITNPLKLRALMTSNIFGGIFGKDQTVSDMEGNIVDPKDAFDDT